MSTRIVLLAVALSAAGYVARADPAIQITSSGIGTLGDEDYDFDQMIPLESPTEACEVSSGVSDGVSSPNCFGLAEMCPMDSCDSICAPSTQVCAAAEPAMCVCAMPAIQWFNCRPNTTDTKGTRTSGFALECPAAIANADANLESQIQHVRDQCEGLNGTFTNVANYSRLPGVGRCEVWLPGRPTLWHGIGFDVSCTFGPNDCPRELIPPRELAYRRCADQYRACLNAGVTDARCWNQYIACIRAVEGR